MQVDGSAGRSGGGIVRRERDSSIVDGIPPFYARSRNERINDTSQDYSESVVADPLNTGRLCVTVIPEVVVDETGDSGNTCRILERGGGAAVKKFMATKRQGVIIRVTPSTL